MKELLQTSCSELLVDTSIHDPSVAYDKLTLLCKKYGWETSPPLTVTLLEELKKENEDYDEDRDEIVIYDKHGNRTWLEYGYNGYIHTGFRLDTQCSHCDVLSYPLFRVAIKELNGDLISCDGGSVEPYYEWEAEHEDDCSQP